LRSKYHAPKVHITRRKANITEKDLVLRQGLFLVGEGVIRRHSALCAEVGQVALGGLDNRRFACGENGQLATTVVLLAQDYGGSAYYLSQKQKDQPGWVGLFVVCYKLFRCHYYFLDFILLRTTNQRITESKSKMVAIIDIIICTSIKISTMLIIEPIKRHIEANKSTIFTLLITSPLFNNYSIK